MDGSVLSVSSRALVDACGRMGLDTAQILAAAGLDAATLQDPDSRIPIAQVEALWRKAYELSKDSNLALHAIEVLPFGAYRVIDFLASSAPTIGAALAKVSDYFPLINDLVRLPYVVCGDEVTLLVEAPTRPAVITRPYAEYTLAAIFLRTRLATNQRFPLRRVEFSHPRPADVSEHERVFDCPVRFDAGRCQIAIALQRRLRIEGVVFNDLLDEMRFRAAQAYLAQRDVAGAEVAYLLGFAEQSSFNRAFKRWSGKTPTEFRRGTLS